MSKFGRKHDLHPSRSPHMDWLTSPKSDAERQKRAVAPKTRCSMFSDGKHRIAVSPAGVRTRCLCGADR